MTGTALSEWRRRQKQDKIVHLWWPFFCRIVRECHRKITREQKYSIFCLDINLVRLFHSSSVTGSLFASLCGCFGHTLNIWGQKRVSCLSNSSRQDERQIFSDIHRSNRRKCDPPWRDCSHFLSSSHHFSLKGLHKYTRSDWRLADEWLFPSLTTDDSLSSTCKKPDLIRV